MKFQVVGAGSSATAAAAPAAKLHVERTCRHTCVFGPLLYYYLLLTAAAAAAAAVCCLFTYTRDRRMNELEKLKKC